MPTDEEIKAKQAKDARDKAVKELDEELDSADQSTRAAKLLGDIANALRRAGVPEADIFERAYQAVNAKADAEINKIHGKQKALNVSGGASSLAAARNLIEDIIQKEEKELGGVLGRVQREAAAGNVEAVLNEVKEVARISLELKGKEQVKNAFL